MCVNFASYLTVLSHVFSVAFDGYILSYKFFVVFDIASVCYFWFSDFIHRICQLYCICGTFDNFIASFSWTLFLFWQDVLSVAFSVDNRQIVSGSRDKTIKLWNTLAECKYTIQEDGHSDWVRTCIIFSQIF